MANGSLRTLHFLRKLPELTPDQYETLVKSSPKTYDEMMQGMESGQMDHDGH
jgi:hypothetical protein